jgi:hypothetical protein
MEEMPLAVRKPKIEVKSNPAAALSKRREK